MFVELVNSIKDKSRFAFRIMGKDWHDILKPLVEQGLQVDYFSEFDYDTHKLILDSSDYSLYLGIDDGSMGILDSAQAGLKLIAPNVGYHQEIGIDFPFNNQEGLNEIFKNLTDDRVADWTWENYVKKHLSIWKKIYDTTRTI